MSTARLAGSKRPVAFMSYAHHDDSGGSLTTFRDRLVAELRSQTGTDVEIFMDSDAIRLGEQWRKRLNEGLATSTFLLPIITPSFLTSPYCRDELETFRGHEQALGREDLILPVYYIDCEHFRGSAVDEAAAAALEAVLERQYFDWRKLRTVTPGQQRVSQARIELAGEIRMAMARIPSSSEPVPGPVDEPPPARDVPAGDDVASETSPSDASATSPSDDPGASEPRDPLPECCVRIEVGGRHAGSGFFAAPGIVVTCYHVLRLGDLSSEEVAAISVISPNGGTYAVLDARDCAEDDDLALLRVEPASGHPLVLLDTGFRARDTFRTFGFPEDAPGGVSLALRAEDWLQRDRTLGLAPGQVQRGMSGSPVINERTRAVCGVLKRGGVGAGEPGAALEGHVVSVRRLFALSPPLDTTNFRYHTTHKRNWFGLLPPEQQRMLLKQRKSDPASLPDCLLVISVEQHEEEWQVSASVHRRDEEHDEWEVKKRIGSIKVDLNSVRALVARVFRDWASRDAAEQGRVGPGEQIRLLGEILSTALLTDRIGEEFHELIMESDVGWVEVALHFSEVQDADFREFVQLPWEHLFAPQKARRGDVYFAREPKLAFVRTLHPDPSTPEPPGGKLGVLVVSVKPEDPGPQGEAAREVDEITAALKVLETELAGSLDVTVIQSPGLLGLQEAVGSGDYDVLHYVGFGRFETGNDDRIALAVNPSGRVEYHNASNLADCLEGTAMPRLVVLQICRDGETVPADLAVFGPALLMEERCQAVVAYQYPVKSELTQRFNIALYTALVGGAPLEMAAQMARRKVWSSDSEGRAFLSPAVFVRNPGGLRLAPRGREMASRSRVGALSGHA
jgi:hypothetical protein